MAVNSHFDTLLCVHTSFFSVLLFVQVFTILIMPSLLIQFLDISSSISFMFTCIASARYFAPWSPILFSDIFNLHNVLLFLRQVLIAITPLLFTSLHEILRSCNVMLTSIASASISAPLSLIPMFDKFNSLSMMLFIFKQSLRASISKLSIITTPCKSMVRSLSKQQDINSFLYFSCVILLENHNSFCMCSCNCEFSNLQKLVMIANLPYSIPTLFHDDSNTSTASSFLI